MEGDIVIKIEARKGAGDWSAGNVGVQTEVGGGYQPDHERRHF